MHTTAHKGKGGVMHYVYIHTCTFISFHDFGSINISISSIILRQKMYQYNIYLSKRCLSDIYISSYTRFELIKSCTQKWGEVGGYCKCIQLHTRGEGWLENCSFIVYVLNGSLHVSLKEQSLAQLHNRLLQLPIIRFHSQNLCVINRLTSCVISIIPNFLAGFVQKMTMTKRKLFSVTSVNSGFILNVTTLIILSFLRNCDESCMRVFLQKAASSHPWCRPKILKKKSHQNRHVLQVDTTSLKDSRLLLSGTKLPKEALKVWIEDNIKNNWTCTLEHLITTICVAFSFLLFTLFILGIKIQFNAPLEIIKC